MRYVPSDIKAHYDNLSNEGKKTFKKQFSKKRIHLTVLYFAWLFFGIHYAALGRWVTQILFYILGGGALLLSSNFGLGKLAYFIAAIWWIVDFFRLPFIAKKVNSEKAFEIIKEVKMLDSVQL